MVDMNFGFSQENPESKKARRLSLNFDKVISLLKSNNINADTRSRIYESLDQIIRNNYQYND